jgi:DNA-binding transcriptional LysR family regulator
LTAINLLYLETFLAVCEYRNFTEAAKHLYVPQPTVTNRIHYLEAELGQELFARGKSGKRSVRLTEAGRIFLPYARNVVASIEAAKKELTARSQSNLIRIGSSVPFTHPFIIDKIKALYSFHQDISLSFTEKANVFHLLRDNTIDIAFTTDCQAEANFESHLLGTEDFQLILSAENPLSSCPYIEDFTCMESENLICYKPYVNSLEESLLSRYHFKKKLLSNQLGIIRNLLKHNYGITLLPPLLLDKELQTDNLKSIPLKLDIPAKKISYSLVYKKGQFPYMDELLRDHA